MSTQGISLVNRWLSGCVDGHAATCKAEVHDQLQSPSRLIHIGTDSEMKLLPHLIDVERASAGLPLSYAALNHCWEDQENSFTTLMINVENIEYVSGWPKNIAKTIQDAIQVTHNLGLEYLWSTLFVSSRMIQPTWNARLRK